MPTYRYKNLDTGEIYEFKQSMRDEALTQHPETGAAIKRIVSAPAISFKGSGFYATDSRRSAGGGKQAAGEGGAGPEGSKVEAGKPEGGKGDSGKAAESAAPAPAKEAAAPASPKAAPAKGSE
ncbi:MAG: FmdB family zinc ribbon protein [Deinococcus sp.]